MNNETITITGYTTDCNCEHCGRNLRHGIRINDGRVVGAQCLDQVMTKPKTYGGKAYRIGKENVIRYARLAGKYTESGLRRFGIYPDMLTFEKA